MKKVLKNNKLYAKEKINHFQNKFSVILNKKKAKLRPPETFYLRACKQNAIYSFMFCYFGVHVLIRKTC